MPLSSENAKNYYNFLRTKQHEIMQGKPGPEFQLVPEGVHPTGQPAPMGSPAPTNSHGC